MSRKLCCPVCGGAKYKSVEQLGLFGDKELLVCMDCGLILTFEKRFMKKYLSKKIEKLEGSK
ncbi:MAG: hypothetical protein N4A68_07515 [Maledivibacter sp.]|nr:hypothetical protein [Maledivibacter sp.]